MTNKFVLGRMHKRAGWEVGGSQSRVGGKKVDCNFPDFCLETATKETIKSLADDKCCNFWSKFLKRLEPGKMFPLMGKSSG